MKERLDYCKSWENEQRVVELDASWKREENIACKVAVKNWIKKNVLPSDTILDAGCGTGFYIKTVIDICGKDNYKGIDATSKMIDFCKKKFPDIKFSQGNILNLNNIRANSFDIVMNIDVIVHLPVYRPVIKELYRVARKKVIIKTALTDSPTRGKPAADDFSRVHWVNYNKDEFLNTVKDIIAKEDEIILYDNVRDISSAIKGECRWALIEIQKNVGIFYIKFSDIINNGGERDVSKVTEEQILKAYNNGEFGPLLLYPKSNILENGHLRYSLFKKAGLEKVLVTYDRSKQVKGASHKWYNKAVLNDK